MEELRVDMRERDAYNGLKKKRSRTMSDNKNIIYCKLIKGALFTFIMLTGLIWFNNTLVFAETESEPYFPNNITMERRQSIVFDIPNSSIVSKDKAVALDSTLTTIKGRRTGTATVTYRYNGEKRNCKVKVVVKNKKHIYGTYEDGDSEFSVVKVGKNKYAAQMRLYRLCNISGLVGKYKKGKITFKGNDPNGNPITISAKIKNGKLTATIKATTWTYFQNGQKYTFKK